MKEKKLTNKNLPNNKQKIQRTKQNKKTKQKNTNHQQKRKLTNKQTNKQKLNKKAKLNNKHRCWFSRKYCVHQFFLYKDFQCAI